MNDVTQEILQVVQKPKSVQADVVKAYKIGLAEMITKGENLDWPAINQAIIDKWSQSGLARIKEAAWRWE